jgi:drug/metabolite transporter (DMT)-like permease
MRVLLVVYESFCIREIARGKGTIAVDTASGRLSGLIFLASGASMISFSGVWVKLAHVGPTTAGFYRTLFGGLILLALATMGKETFWKGWRPFLTALVCALFFALDLTFWHRSIRYVGPGLATILANFQVFFLSAFGVVVLRERPGWRFALSVPLSLAGLFLIVGVNWGELHADYKTGVLLGLATAACYAANFLTLRQSQIWSESLTPRANLAIIALMTSLFMAAEGWGQGETFVIPDFQSWTALIAYGLVSQVLGWICIYRGLLRIEASRAGLILLLQPTLAFVWDIFFFSRPTGLKDGVGALLALGAIYLGTTKAGR